jgi:hypothetical protein
MEWSVFVEAVAKKGSRRLGIDDPAIERFVDALSGRSSSIAAGGRIWSARVAVEAPTVEVAISTAEDIVLCAAAAAGLPPWPVLKVEAIEWGEFVRELGSANGLVRSRT